MASEPQVGTNHPIEQFILLAKSAKGAAVVALIKQVLEAPGVYVFGELLEMPNVQELAGTSSEPYLNLLNLFAFGTYQDYKAKASTLPELSQAQRSKLRHLTIVSLAASNKCIPYPVLQQQLDMKNLRELEDLIIESVYADIIQGKLDQKNQLLEVDQAIGRDILPQAVSHIVTVLQEWCDGCELILSGIEEQILKANTHKEQFSRTKQDIETEVANIKKTLKTTSQELRFDEDQQMSSEVKEQEPLQHPAKPVKKTSKVKGLRGSGKFWQKNN